MASSGSRPFTLPPLDTPADVCDYLVALFTGPTGALYVSPVSLCVPRPCCCVLYGVSVVSLNHRSRAIFPRACHPPRYAFLTLFVHLWTDRRKRSCATGSVCSLLCVDVVPFRACHTSRKTCCGRPTVDSVRREQGLPTPHTTWSIAHE